MNLPELSSFLDTTRLPLGAQGFLDVWQFVFYFWFGVVLLCILALLVAVSRRFQHRPFTGNRLHCRLHEHPEHAEGPEYVVEVLDGTPV